MEQPGDLLGRRPAPTANVHRDATSDTGGGEVYVYAGTKQRHGNPVERAGLTDGTSQVVCPPGPRARQSWRTSPEPSTCELTRGSPR